MDVSEQARVRVTVKPLGRSTEITLFHIVKKLGGGMGWGGEQLCCFALEWEEGSIRINELKFEYVISDTPL